MIGCVLKKGQLPTNEKRQFNNIQKYSHIENLRKHENKRTRSFELVQHLRMTARLGSLGP